MRNPMIEKDLIKTLSHYFASRPEIRLGYLFGSHALGRANPMSDIDIAVLVDEKQGGGSYPYGYKARICTDLMKILKTNHVDVVLLNKASYFLRHRVISCGRPLYAREEIERVYFEADTMGRYPDIKRLLALHQ